jgi:hypothetical protein
MHHSADAGGQVLLGQRDRAQLAVVVGERGLACRQQEPATDAHDQDRAYRHRGDGARRQPDGSRGQQRDRRPEQRAPAEGALEPRRDHARDRAPGRERGHVQPARGVAQVELLAQVHDDQPGTRSLPLPPSSATQDRTRGPDRCAAAAPARSGSCWANI